MLIDPSMPSCELCGSESRFYCSKEEARYYRCVKCGLIFQHPLPLLEEMMAYANDEYTNGLYREYLQARDLKYRMFCERVAILKEHTNGDRLLDVGCSSGYLIDAALDAGFDAYGIEGSEVAIAGASERARRRILQGDVNQIDMTPYPLYHVITAFDIIEHTLNPTAFLKRLNELLSPGGILAITTPDADHFLRALMGRRWPMLQPFQHTFIFSHSSLQLALQQNNYDLIEIVPARKLLTPDYLAKQLEIHNPLISRTYNIISHALPKKVRNSAIWLNISEMMALAAKPGRKVGS
jgi:2-polyprenyl-3-methyl-5-hydroxy-6-metoxy-1,4-benzoquinol methylase